MSSVTTYLNFPGTTEAAFELYKSAFGTEFSSPIARMGGAPGMPEMPKEAGILKQIKFEVKKP